MAIWLLIASVAFKLIKLNIFNIQNFQKMIKQCEHCGKEFEAKKESAAYCSDSHRQLAYKHRNYEKQVKINRDIERKAQDERLRAEAEENARIKAEKAELRRIKKAKKLSDSPQINETECIKTIPIEEPVEIASQQLVEIPIPKDERLKPRKYNKYISRSSSLSKLGQLKKKHTTSKSEMPFWARMLHAAVTEWKLNEALAKAKSETLYNPFLNPKQNGETKKLGDVQKPLKLPPLGSMTWPSSTNMPGHLPILDETTNSLQEKELLADLSADNISIPDANGNESLNSEDSDTEGITV